MDKSSVFHRRLDRDLPTAVQARGVWITDREGKQYLDASGGPVCVNVGHGRQEVVEAMAAQAARVDYVHGPMFTTETVETLAKRLASHAPGSIDRFYFCSSGCEAIETAMKLARQIQTARGESGRYRVISRWYSYHGSTLGALSATGKPGMRNPFIPMLPPSIHIPPPYCLRCHYHLTYPECHLRCAHALDEAIRREGKDTISAFLTETILGSTIGAVVPPREYYEIISAICQDNGVLLILDEVMCGMGRSGTWFGAEHYGIEPDMMVLGKGLNGGYAPLSAVGCRRSHLDLLRQHRGNFIHGHTFSHHPVAAAAALAVVDILERENLVERAHDLGKYLGKALTTLSDHPHVAEVRGIGMMWAIEFAEEKGTLKTFPRKEKVTERVWDSLMESGVITYKCIGFAGGEGDAIMIAPPFTIKKKELDLVMETMGSVLEKVLGQAHI
ncbi:MAG: aspartate aminotransferase family protein [Deltaproteobacteria bacterium]|nr:aspartate aminotransferase family protein [Deltaproteobacteria bacterium]MBW2047956.1 aspartate aminotransferase family protein [Deltaproteobacteria bacterium]MBW2111430.1 aspartate aminotransferase family protein [Deltaproteobacteria bacterium]MBW2352917.1 aspartate aminotransferase family protein [Deltaproteobacteria bacterium]